MYARVLKAVWFFSFVGFMISFIYIYAALSPEVLLQLDRFAITISRDTLFYTSLLVISLVNILVFLIEAPLRGQDVLKIWVFGQVITVNFFFIIVLVLIMLINSGEEFDYKRIGILVYGSVTILVLWILSGLVYLTLKKINK